MKDKVTGRFKAKGERSKVCTTKKCNKETYCRSMCKKCYEHMKRYGRPLNKQQIKVKNKKINAITIKGNQATVTVGNKITLVDTCDVPLVLRKRWCVSAGGYAMSGHKYLHHYLHGKPDKKYIDHINRNKLDNRSANIRLVTPQQNTWNSNGFGKSGQNGVHWDSQTNSWAVRVNRKWFGRYKEECEAIRAAKEARSSLYGDFAL